MTENLVMSGKFNDVKDNVREAEIIDWEPESAVFLPPLGLPIFHPRHYLAERGDAFSSGPSAALPTGDWRGP